VIFTELLYIGAGVIALLVAAVFIAYEVLYPHYDKNNGTVLETQGKVVYVKNPGGTPYLMKTDANGEVLDTDFKIVTSTDLHAHSENSGLSFGALSRFLDMEKPDLVILLGDNVVGHTDDEYQKKMIRFFEERKQYYGFVLGNHDPEKRIREATAMRAMDAHTSVEELPVEMRKEIVKAGRKWAFETQAASPYCIVFDEDPSLQGAGTCAVNIRNSHKITQSLFFFDSGDYVLGLKRKDYGTEKRCYGNITKEQLLWYERRLREITEENHGDRPKSMAFFHIPFPEYYDAFREARLHRNGTKRIFGTNFEKPCSGDVNEGAFETMLKNGSTRICVCGHDHKNDSVIRYRGITLMYSMGLPFDGAYNRHKKSRVRKLLYRISPKLNTFSEGVSVFRVEETGRVEIHARYAHDIDAYRGLERYFKSAYFM